MRFRLLPLALLFALPAPAAPVPKEKPRDGVIMVAINRRPTLIRLYKPDGTLISERSVENVCDCSFSPDGKRVAVSVLDATANGANCDVFVVDTTADGKELGEPLASGFHHTRMTWADGRTLYVSNSDPPSGGNGLLVPAEVTVCDVVKRTTAVEEKLKGRVVVAVSPNGKRLLTGQVDAKAKWEFHNELLDRDTLKPVDLAADGLTFRNFLDDDTLVGVRPKKGGASGEYDFLLWDVTAKKATAMTPPKEVTEKGASVLRVLPAPDGRRMLVLWSEEVEKPADWQDKEPCRPRRVTVCDRDGGNAKTILRPEVKAMADYYDTQFGWVDWR